MKTVKIKVYSFNELSEDAKQKAIENFSDINVDFDWWDCTYEDFKQLCKTICIDVDLKKTYFNGFYSQGSGSSFTADITNVKDCLMAIKGEKWKDYAPKEKLSFYEVTKNLLRIAPYCYGNIKPTNRESSVKCELEIESYSSLCTNVEKEFENMEDFFEDVANELNNFLYRQLETEYEYLTGEEAIKESIIANDYEFTIDGKRF